LLSPQRERCREHDQVSLALWAIEQRNLGLGFNQVVEIWGSFGFCGVVTGDHLGLL